MFERRTRIVLACLVLASIGLLLRAGQLQIAQAGQWQAVADEALRHSSYTEFTRGRILDAKGRVMAEDVPCNDAAVAFWFVSDPPEPKHLKLLARDLARQTPGYYEAESADQERRVEAQLPAAEERVNQLWETLAVVGNVTTAEIEERRRTIMHRVELRRRAVIQRRYRLAMQEHEEAELSPWWRRWLLGEADAPPELAQFDEPIADEQQAHVVLRDLSNEQYNTLLKLEADLPPTLRQSLTLRASRTRRYPEGRSAAHVLGQIAEVSRQDLADDDAMQDERRRYLPGDLIGKGGLEALGERILRGTRGRIDRDFEKDTRTVAFEPVDGGDITTTLDAELCNDIRKAFENVEFRWPSEPGVPREDLIETGPMPGAAVVIDVKTGGVLAMVSAPDFDPNEYADQVAELYADEINRPTLNRATQFATVPGSTVKPIIGLAATGEGLLDPHETIECDGYFHAHLPGGKVLNFTSSFRCWTASMYGQYAAAQRHGGGLDPHPTTGLNPDGDPFPGFMTFADALQRSCNVFFFNLATRLQLPGLDRWYDKFGLGRPTGVGLPEQSGLVPGDIPDRELNADGMARWRHAWWAGIGQGYVQATPIQMANVAATLARGGIWMPPSLLADQPAKAGERVDLKFDASAIEMVRRGMWAAVHTPSGSGNHIDERLPLEIAGKTGSAQAHKLTIALRDAKGDPLLDENGNARYERLDQLSTRGNPNPEAPWYRRTNSPNEAKVKVTHAWFIGYAPAENPTVAFAVFVEYGGSGGYAAGSVVAQTVQALVDRGYLQATRQLAPNLPEGERRYVTE